MLAARATVVTWGREAPGRRNPRPGTGRSVRRRPSGVTRLALLFAVIAALLLLYVAEQAVVISLTYRLSGVKAALHSATVETDRLQLKISELSSPARLERVAREDLHLISPGEATYLVGAVKVALVKPAEEKEPGLPVIARIRGFFRGPLVQAAQTAQ